MTSNQEFLSTIKSEYRSGKSNLGKEFFSPCMSRCTEYRRAAGYFSSSAVLTWCELLDKLIKHHKIPIKLIVSPELSPEDAQALRSASSEEGRKAIIGSTIEHWIGEVLSSPTPTLTAQFRVQIFSWLVATGALELRFAFPKHVDDASIFHTKIGIFDFEDGQRIAFTGSANESISGHERNYESIDVFRSWVHADAERVTNKLIEFDEAWNGQAEGLSVEPLTPDSLAKIVERKPSSRPKPPEETEIGSITTEAKTVPDPSAKWRHQDDAVARFMEKRAGILEMATGTGKTRTALKILSSLIKEDRIDSALVVTSGTDLLDQWSNELMAWSLDQPKPLAILRHYEKYKELATFALDPEGYILVISLNQLVDLFQRWPDSRRLRTAIVHDEVHGLGIPTAQEFLIGQHKAFPYKLGLSATPEREYDAEGSKFIESEIGEVIFRFGLQAAISREILCEFDYTALNYDLTKGDKERLQKVYAAKAAREKAGNPMSKEQVWTEISKIYKTAEMKPAVFRDYLKHHPDIIQSTIIFVETMDYGSQILPDLQEYTNLYRTYYADDDRDNLVSFSQGHIDCLITCHRISQGIDIKMLSTVILFASARAKLETIQRIGRCLRTDPNNPGKRARVIDFVRTKEDDAAFPSADEDRFEWLRALSQVKKGDKVEY